MAYKNTVEWACTECNKIQATSMGDTFSCGYCGAKSTEINPGRKALAKLRPSERVNIIYGRKPGVDLFRI